jgi:type I restriction enzyme S subunit
MAGESRTNPTSLPPTPDGWREMQIEELCERVTSGGTPSRQRPEFYENGVFSWFKTKELKDCALYDSEERITQDALDSSSAKLFPPNTILMAMYGDGITITSLGILRREAATNQACCAMIPKSKVCEPRFLFYSLLNHREDFIRIASGGAQRNLSGSLIRRFALNAPPLAEQKAIAAALGTLDDKIELNRRTNATLEAMARALFQSWFVDFDPVRAKLDGRAPAGLDEATAAFFPAHLEESELGHTPQGWEVRSLDNIAHYLNGLALQKYPPSDGPTLRVIKIAQLRKGDSVGADRCNTDLPPDYVVQDGDVLFSWSGSLEVELWCGGPGALNQHLFKVTSPEFPKWFYYFWTLYHLDEFRLIAAGKATTMGHIQRGHLSAAKVLIPPKPLLDNMTRTMSPLIEQIIANRIQSRTLATLRDTLLPKLLSGELNVAGAENELTT